MRITACTLALGLVVAVPAHARPPAPREAPKVEPVTESEKVDAAIKAWAAGDWSRVRALLEPMLQSGGKLAEPLLEETALRYLADATIQDESFDLRDESAAGYMERLLASSPDWRPPESTHSPKFYDLYFRVREQRDRTRAAQCDAQRASCRADLDELEARHKKLTGDHQTLLKAHAEQEVEVREKVARNRAVALFPFGIGHFYNGRKGLGAAFLSSELVFGGVGLGLLLFRLSECKRTAGFQRESLNCTGDREGILLRRNLEQTAGLFFVGLVALDILIAQITFRSAITVKKTRVRRSELRDDDDATLPAGKKPRGRQPPAAGAPSSRLRTRDILRAAPAPALFPGGGGLGVSVRF